MWRRGVFLGMNSKSIDSIISTHDGIQLARTVRSVPEDESWNIDALGKIQSYIEFIGCPDDADGYAGPVLGTDGTHDDDGKDAPRASF